MKKAFPCIWGGILVSLLSTAAVDGAGYDPDSPWPCMRHDYLNTGRADDIRPSQVEGLEQVPIWTYKTDRPIFSTPVVGADGTVYIGSADFVFYAINPDGSLKWKVRTGRLIDSAASLSADGRVYVPGGDGFIYALDQRTGREYWRFQAFKAREDRVEIISWFEGNVTLSPWGTILAGNDDFYLYELDQDGSVNYTYETGGIIWSAIPTDEGGRHFFCSLDMNCYGVDRNGNHLWKTGFWGILSASPSISPDGTVYTAGFDGNVYSLDPDTGKKNWTFKTGDHVYSSVAIAEDGTLYVASTDGTMYALIDKGDAVEVKWAYDTLDPIRSSPVIDGDGNIYFGNSDGRLFVLNPDGARSWSLNLTESDKNDINASMALGENAVYLAMQDGRIMQVPYNYCLNHKDERCSTAHGEDLPPDGEFIYWMTPGGSARLVDETVEGVLPGSVITLRLAARKGGDTLMAGIEKSSLKVEVEPWFPHHVTVSLDHRFINIVPEEMLERGGEYQVKVSGRYREQGFKLLGHIWLTRGERLGEFDGAARFKVSDERGVDFEEGVPLVLTHMSFYQPMIFPSFAQIGMDDMNFIVVPVEEVEPGLWNAWGVVAAPTAEGGYRPEPGNRVTFPARIEYHGDIIKIYSGNIEFDHAGDRLGMKYFLATGLLEQPGKNTLISINTLYSEGKNFSMAGSFYDVPVMGTPLSGTMHISPVDLPESGPEGFEVTRLGMKGRKIIAEYDNQAGVKAADNSLSIMVIDNKTRMPLFLDYAGATSHVTDEAGNILKSEVELPLRYSADKNLFAVVFINAVELRRGEL